MHSGTSITPLNEKFNRKLRQLGKLFLSNKTNDPLIFEDEKNIIYFRTISYVDSFDTYDIVTSKRRENETRKNK